MGGTSAAAGDVGDQAVLFPQDAEVVVGGRRTELDPSQVSAELEAC